MKRKWRIIQYHPEDRYEPEDDVADGIRKRLREIEDQEKSVDKLPSALAIEQRRLRVELAERLYGT